MTNYKQVYINGQWVTPSSSETIEVWDSTDESVMATIPSCGAADVELAAKAARAAFDSWAALTPKVRAEYISKIGDGLAAKMDEISSAISRETGMSKFLSQMIQVGLPINSFKQAAAIAENFTYSKKSARRLWSASQLVLLVASLRGTIRCTKLQQSSFRYGGRLHRCFEAKRSCSDRRIHARRSNP